MYNVDNVWQLAADGKMDMHGGWNQIWGSVTSAAPNLVNFLTVLGVLLVVAAALGWIFAKHKQKSFANAQTGAGSHHGLLAALLVGCVLLLPNTIIPMALTVFDWVANIFINLFDSAAG